MNDIQTEDTRIDETGAVPTVRKDEVAEFPHGKVGEKEQAKITKRQIENIARRAGKDPKDIARFRKQFIRLRGEIPRVAYTVVAE